MRVEVIGDAGGQLAALLTKAGHLVSTLMPSYSVTLVELAHSPIVIDGADAEWERACLSFLAELCDQDIVVRIKGGEVHSDTALRILFPPDQVTHVHKAIIRSLDRETERQQQLAVSGGPEVVKSVDDIRGVLVQQAEQLAQQGGQLVASERELKRVSVFLDDTRAEAQTLAQRLDAESAALRDALVGFRADVQDSCDTHVSALRAADGALGDQLVKVAEAGAVTDELLEELAKRLAVLEQRRPWWKRWFGTAAVLVFLAIAGQAFAQGQTVRQGKAGTDPWAVTFISASDVLVDRVKITDGTDVANVTAGGKVEVTCDNCGGGTTDTDDASIATGQSSGLMLGLNQAFDGTVWRRLTFGTAGTAAAQVWTVQGIASMTPLQVQSNSANLATQTTLSTIDGGIGIIEAYTGIQSVTALINDATFDTGVNRATSIGVMFDDTAPGTTTENSVRPLRGSTRRELYTQIRDAAGNERGANVTADNALAVSLVAATANGADGFSYISAGATEDEHAVKATAGTLYSITVTNTNAAVRYLKCENDTAAGTAPGTDTPEFRMAVPGATTGAGFTATFPVGYSFSTALTCWLVTGAADSDVAEVAASELIVFYTFK